MTVLESMTKEDKCVIYSLGVFDDSSWEKEMIDRTKCQVYAFDASVKGIAGGKLFDLCYVSRSYLTTMHLGVTFACLFMCVQSCA